MIQQTGLSKILTIPPIVRVQSQTVAGAFLPSDLSGLVLWLANDTGLYEDSAKTTPATDDGDVVGAWEDQSGQGNDALQATTANKPLLKLSIVNGENVVRFDGTNDRLEITDDASLKPSNLMVFAVFKLNTTLASQSNGFPVIYDKYKLSVGGHGLVFDRDADTFHMRFVDDNGDIKDAVITSADTEFGTGTHLVTGSYNSTTREVRLDGVDKNVIIETFTLAHTTESFWVGAFDGTSNYPDADIMEIVLYNTGHSDSDRGDVETYLMNKYGIS